MSRIDHPIHGPCLRFQIPEEFRGMYYIRMHFVAIQNMRIFLHDRNSFWYGTTQEPGILGKNNWNFLVIEIKIDCFLVLVTPKTISQFQVNFEKVETIQNDKNNCSMTNFDDCFEEYLTQQLSCKPYETMDMNLPLCNNEESLKKSNETLMKALENMNEICQLECHFTNIHISSRNYEERGSRTRAYFYFPYKIKLRYY